MRGFSDLKFFAHFQEHHHSPIIPSLLLILELQGMKMTMERYHLRAFPVISTSFQAVWSFENDLE